jgi:hypothetical protein
MNRYLLETTQGDEIGGVFAASEEDARDRWAQKQGYGDWADAVNDQAVEAEIEVRLAECNGHPAGPSDQMGTTVFCDGSCR